MRVAFPFVGDTVGGSHISAGLLIRELPVFGFDPVVFSHVAGPLINFFKSQGIDCSVADLPFMAHRIDPVTATVGLPRMSTKLATFLRRKGIALVHANDARIIHSWTPASRLARVPIIAHRRTAWSPSRLSFLMSMLAHEIIGISEHVKTSLPSALRRKTEVIYNPFEPTQSNRNAARERLVEIAGGDGFIVLSVGSLVDQKRPTIVLSAAEQLVQRYSSARFIFVGRETPLLHELRQQAARLGLSDKVAFAGFRQDAQSLMAGADVVVAPAVNEGFGRTLVEAMLARVPVVASQSGAHTEIVQHGINGLLVTPDSAQALAEAVGLLLDNPHLASTMVDQAYDWVQDRFSPSNHARQVASRYRGLLARKAQLPIIC